ncbi:MAG: biotin synthase BioB, partial [Candidatus Omnitrophica bacterium]|nr:biotin synthase BioB [Candidatus Omnitrophota bacterium]
PTMKLNPEFCLRILCLFRFLNPKAEIRIAAGRELHLRDMEVLALYPGNSLFLDGYLNTKGEQTLKTLQMIKDAGFKIRSNHSIDEILNNNFSDSSQNKYQNSSKIILKNLTDLRPHILK